MTNLPAGVPPTPSSDEAKRLREQLESILKGGGGPRIARFFLAVLSGIPIAGGALSGASGLWSERSQEGINQVVQAWMQLQQDEIEEIGKTLIEVLARVDVNDQQTNQRLRSPEFLSLIKKCFREWSAAESETKRDLIRNLLTNAASCRLCTDDVVRSFVEWIDKYSEAHFKVIRTIYKGQSMTRLAIWRQIHGERVREDSADADLFKLIIHELTTGWVIRQHRETDYHGNFIKQTARPAAPSNVMKSAFDDDKRYELTELGKQFVHYTMNEIVPRLAASNDEPDSAVTHINAKQTAEDSVA